MNEIVAGVGAASLAIVIEAGTWVIASLFVAGLVHEFLDTTWVRKQLNRSGAASVGGALGLGALLPICSCGVIPLAVSLYLSGARLAAVMTFTAATPVINPAAVVLSYALLGPELTLAYIAFGLAAPVLVGLAAERWGERHLTPVATRLQSCCGETAACCKDTHATGSADSLSFARRFGNAMRWGFGELGPTLGLYIGVGAFLAGLVTTLVPPDWIVTYLGGSAPFVSLLLIALFGASIYVCAVAHIPLVAALLASGAGPGAAIVFLVTGAATNLPEFIALQRTLGTRTVIVYVIGMVALSLVAGLSVNLWLLPGYEPVMDPQRSLRWSDLAWSLAPTVPDLVALVSAGVVLALMVWGAMRWLHERLPNGRRA